MKVFASLVAGSILLQSATAHYIFQYLTLGSGMMNPQYQFIRKNTNYNSPVIDLAAPELRCNVGGNNGTYTSTTTVAAGSSVTFTADVAVYHQGPVCFYMAKAPSTAALYDGSGTSWFKIKQIGPTFDASGNANWSACLQKSFTVTIPAKTPPGEYLLRIEQLAIHNPYPAGIPQFYISCAQIKVTGSGGGTPSPKVNIPGHVKATDSGYVVNIYNNFHSYVIPGPAVWSGN